jgi:hypothetical protein
MEDRREISGTRPSEMKANREPKTGRAVAAWATAIDPAGPQKKKNSTKIAAAVLTWKSSWLRELRFATRGDAS